MRFGSFLRCFLAVTVVAVASAQTPAPTPNSTGPRLPVAKRTDKSARQGKAVIPDPDLLDGSAQAAEKHPLYGMLAEIEVGGKEGDQAAKVSPESGQGGGEKSAAPQSPGGQGGTDPKIAGGPEAPAEGVQVADLKVPEGAASGGPNQNSAKPRDLQIGDATLQIQQLAKNTQNVVGTESSTSQQYEKKVPAGAPPSGDNRNVGVEKGRVVPKGL